MARPKNTIPAYRKHKKTGMRCGELCQMRACDLDITGETWLYRPEHHKGFWRGKDRVIAIGPQSAHRNPAPRTYPTHDAAIRAVEYRLGTPSASWRYLDTRRDILRCQGPVTLKAAQK